MLKHRILKGRIAMAVPKSVSLGASVAVALVAALLAASSTVGNSFAEPENQQLNARINDLENRVAELERMQTTVILPAPQAPAQIPGNWKPKAIMA